MKAHLMKPEMFTPEIRERFYSKVREETHPPKGAMYEGLTPCHTWTGGMFTQGYGAFHISPQVGLSKAHTVAWILSEGCVEEGEVIRHRCDNPACVNPDHLIPGSMKDNSKDMVDRGRSLKGDLNPARQNPASLARGSSHKNSKLSEEKVSMILVRFYHKDESADSLAKEFGVGRSAMLSLLRGRTWSHVNPEGIIKIKEASLVRFGESHKNSKYTESQISEVKNLLKSGLRGKDIAQRMGMSKGLVSLIKLNKIWTHVQ